MWGCVSHAYSKPLENPCLQATSLLYKSPLFTHYLQAEVSHLSLHLSLHFIFISKKKTKKPTPDSSSTCLKCISFIHSLLQKYLWVVLLYIEAEDVGKAAKLRQNSYNIKGYFLIIDYVSLWTFAVIIISYQILLEGVEGMGRFLQNRTANSFETL